MITFASASVVIVLLLIACLIGQLIALIFEGWRSEHPKRSFQPTVVQEWRRVPKPMRIVTGDIERIDSHKACRQDKADSASREKVLQEENKYLRDELREYGAALERANASLLSSSNTRPTMGRWEREILRTELERHKAFAIEFRRRMEEYKALYEATSCALTAVRTELKERRERAERGNDVIAKFKSEICDLRLTKDAYKTQYEATNSLLCAVRRELTDVQNRPCVRKPIP